MSDHGHGLLNIPERTRSREASRSRRPSIRIRRYPSVSAVPTTPIHEEAADKSLRDAQDAALNTQRRRSMSAPQPVDNEFADDLHSNELSRLRTAPNPMPTVKEEALQVGRPPSTTPVAPSHSFGGRLGSTRTSRPALPWRWSTEYTKNRTVEETSNAEEYDSELVDFLDVIDPEVAALTTLTNVQNSLFVPDLGRYLNRTATYHLSRQSTSAERPIAQTSQFNSRRLEQQEEAVEDDDAITHSQTRDDRLSITSELKKPYYAVLPHGISLAGWSEEDKAELNDHVRHLLHSRRAKFKRTMKGFGQYVRRPLGLFVTVYAFLITTFGLVWVLFLIGWISGGGKRSYELNVIDNVLVALFAIIGDGLAPFRVVDTYHMIYIAHYQHLTWKLRRRNQLPSLENRNDLPPRSVSDAELGQYPRLEDFVLSSEQQRKLEHHQNKFSKSHTYYKPHETTTHLAFPVNLLIAITALLDLHSCFQIALGTCTWAINYHHRAAVITVTILCCSITCNTMAGILITIGDRRTRKKDVIERMSRQRLTQEALAKMEKAEAVAASSGT